MAQLLIKLKDSYTGRKGQVNPNQVTRPGDIIICRYDGHKWGTKEGLPNFFVINVTGTTYDDLKHYCGYSETHKRKWRVDLSNIDISEGSVIWTIDEFTLRLVNKD